MPASASHERNPLPASSEALKDGMEHFADHCAVCHANDGSGATLVGERTSPRAPDLRHSETQRLTDGELFYIIENGVKLTAMPAFGEGTADGAAETWRLVHFIRHLPTLTESEVREMETLNPKTLEEWREMEEIRKPTEGQGPTSAPRPTTKPHRHRHGQ